MVNDVDDTRSWHPPLLTTTPHQRGGRFSCLDRFNVHRCPTRQVFSGTWIELMTCLPWLKVLTLEGVVLEESGGQPAYHPVIDRGLKSTWSVINSPLLCKKSQSCHEKTSSVEFISRSPTPSPMNSNYRRFAVLFEGFFNPGSGKRRKKKRNRFEQTSGGTYRENIDAFNQRSTC
ncbi:hypothetical protein TNCV_2383101 [Trichonephila clavipes]|nr:hypothetical protein TNCV_2383101 [Trichonephila clavipes]